MLIAPSQSKDNDFVCIAATILEDLGLPYFIRILSIFYPYLTSVYLSALNLVSLTIAGLTTSELDATDLISQSTSICHKSGRASSAQF